VRLADKHVVVTGAGRGIGEALALAASAEGARVCCVDIDLATAEATAATLRAKGNAASAIRCDITRFADVEAALAHAVEEFGPVDVLVANAGGSQGSRVAFLDLTPEIFQRMLDLNLNGAFNCGLVFGRHLAGRGKGSIVFIASLASEFVQPMLSHYCTAKGGVRQLVRAMALELAPLGVRVNAVSPGAVLTPGNEHLLGTAEAQKPLTDVIPMGRLAEPREIAGAVMYLASDEASFTTGAVVLVDGGATVV
jgi:glucose 1-dehydrogenase